MKQIVTRYVFEPGAAGAGTLTLPDFTNIDLGRLIVIVDVTQKRVLCNIGDPSKVVTVAGNVITFAGDTSDCDPDDALSITYDISIDDPNTADYQSPTAVDTEQITWKRNFSGNTLDDLHWEVLQNDPGQDIVVAGGALTISSGTTANETTVIRSKQLFNLPFRAEFCMSLSQRIANQTFFCELVNEAGDTVAGWVFDGVTVTNAKLESTNKGQVGAGSPSAAFTCLTTKAPPANYIIDCRADAIEWLDQAADVITGETTRQARNRSILQPDEAYYVQIRVVNGAVAPASSTDMVIEYILVQAETKLVAEISAGRGNNSGNRAVPVVVNSQSALIASNARIGTVGAAGMWTDETSTALAANATFTGASHDLTGVATGAAFSGLAYAEELRISAEADTAGTLYLEVSRDNVNWRRIKSVATAAAAGSGTVQYAEIVHRPSTRYARAVYVNGAAAQTQFMVQMFTMAS